MQQIIEWKNTDPRCDLVGMKRAEIIIVRPLPNRCDKEWYYYGTETGIGQCEMKNDWCIITTFENNTLVVKDDWNRDWYWILFENPIYPKVEVVAK